MDQVNIYLKIEGEITIKKNQRLIVDSIDVHIETSKTIKCWQKADSEPPEDPLVITVEDLIGAM